MEEKKYEIVDGVESWSRQLPACGKRRRSTALSRRNR